MPVPAAAAAAAGAGAVGKGAATAGAAGAGGGLAGLMASPWFQAIAPLALGIISGQSPQSATGVRTGLGAFDMLQSFADRGSVAKAMEGYSESVSKDVRREVMDRQMNEAILSLGADDPSGGTVNTTYEGQPLSVLKGWEAAVNTLPATARANPSQAGFMLSGLARGAPSPTPQSAPMPSLYDVQDQFLKLQEGLPPGSSMRQTHTGPFGIQTVMEARQPVEEKVDVEQGVTQEAIDAIRRDLKQNEQATVLGPHGAKRTMKGPQPASPAGGGSEFVWDRMGRGWLYNRVTGEKQPVPPGYWEEESPEYVVTRDPSAPGGFSVQPVGR